MTTQAPESPDLPPGLKSAATRISPHHFWLLGAAFGFMFPAVGTLVEMGLRGLDLSLSGAIAAQAGQPLLWIIDSAPLVLALFAAAVGQREAVVLDLKEASADARVREAVDRFFELSPDPMAIIGFDGDLRRVNAGFRRILGYDDKALESLTVFDLIEPDEVDLLRERHERLRAGERPDRADLRIVTRSGDVRRVQWSTVPVVDEGLMYAIGRDVTAEREARDGLTEAKELAEAARVAKDEFLANMSHEIRTPMHGVLGMIDLLSETDLSDSQVELLGAADHSARNLFSVLEDLLDFSTIESGKLALQEEPFQLADTLRGPLKALASRAHAKGLELVYDEGEGTRGHLRGDPRRLSQILTNLVDNAIKFTDSGHVLVQTRTEPIDDRAARVRVTVSDTGVGFGDDVLARVFDAFSQGDGSHTRRFGGTGLGLAIGSRLASMMGGSLTAHSEPGAGSTFELELTLPLADGNEVRSEPWEGMGRRAIVCCASAKTAGALASYLSRISIDSMPATSIEQASAVARHSRELDQPHDVVLIDVTEASPEELGTVGQLTIDPQLGSPKVVLLTARPGVPELGDDPLLASCPVLTLPVFPDELYREVALLMRTSSRGVGETAHETESPATGDGRSLCALVVEDNQVNRVLAAEMLKRRGYEVSIAEDGLEAVDFVRQRDFDLILMDVQMPNMDGLQATQAIRALERDRLRRTPIIAATAHSQKGDRERCLDAGMDDYVAKPIEPAKLDEALFRQIGSRKATFSFQRAVELASGDGDLLSHLVTVYLDDAPKKVAAVRDALRAGDPAGSSDAAGILEETAASLAMPVLRDLAHRVAVLSRRGELEEARQLMAELEAAVTASAKAARDEIGAA